MASGLARGASTRGKKVAFGDGQNILWDKNSETIFRYNPNVAFPKSKPSPQLEWVPFHRGNRIYNKAGDGRWIWNYEWKSTPGEMFFVAEEQRFADLAGKGFVLIEPNVPEWKNAAANKRWPIERYEEVARQLRGAGYDVVQLRYPNATHRLSSARLYDTPDFRRALAVLSRASLYIGPEGGLHHGAAAVNVPAVVLFGGFVPPQVTGYDAHTNLTGGVTEACGSWRPCNHCREAMLKITVDEVVAAAVSKLHA